MAVRHPGCGCGAMSHGEMAKITGRIWAGSRGTKCPETKKIISIYVQGWGDSSAKSHSPAGGKKIQMAERTGCRHKDRQVHVQGAEMEQALTRDQLSWWPSSPAMEWHLWEVTLVSTQRVAPLEFLEPETSTSGSSRNYAAWFPVTLYFVVDYLRLIRGKSRIKLFLWSGHPVWILWGLIMQFTFLFCPSFTEALIWTSVFSAQVLNFQKSVWTF